MSWAMVVAAVGSLVVGELMKPDEPSAPAVKPPTAMPTPGDAADKASKRLSLKQQQERRGRASTILTDTGGTSDKLGG